MSRVICVLVLAAGARWEDPALSELEGHPRLVVLRRCMDVDDLLASASSGQAHVALVALDAPGLDPAVLDLLRRQGVRAVAVSHPDPDPARIRERAVRLGVAEVLEEHELGRLCEVLLSAEGADGTAARARPDAAPEPAWSPSDPAPVVADEEHVVVAVWGPAGAPGRTTVAVNLAAELARRGEPVLLVDADPHGGSVAQQLGILDEASGLLQVARLAGSGLLAERLTTTVRGIGPRLGVVTGLPRADRWREVRPAHLEQTIDLARVHGHVVLDTGFSLEDDTAGDVSGRGGRNALTRTALEGADVVVAVGAADPVGLARLARGLVELGETVPGTPVRVLVNRMRASLGWSEREVAGMVEGFLRVGGLHFAPEDRGAADRAMVAGDPVVHGDSALALAVRELVDALVPRSVPAGARPARWGLRRRRAGTGRRR